MMPFPDRVIARVSLSIVMSCAGFGQQASAPTEFEAAEVRVNNSVQQPVQINFLPGGQLSMRNMPMKELVVQAYKVGDVTGGPSWLDSDRFDILAKAPPNTPADTVRLMLQSLLVERFKLAVHRDQKTMPVYAMVPAKGGFKLQAAAGSGQPRCGPGQGAEGLSHLVCADALPSKIAPSYIDRPVVDLTDLKGAYDFKLDWIPRPLDPTEVAAGATVFDALDKQLGLKLEERRLPMPVIVIEHIERVPTDN
jgi:uncharacterized protein (TIGR03435 family)